MSPSTPSSYPLPPLSLLVATSTFDGWAPVVSRHPMLLSQQIHPLFLESYSCLVTCTLLHGSCAGQHYYSALNFAIESQTLPATGLPEVN